MAKINKNNKSGYGRPGNKKRVDEERRVKAECWDALTGLLLRTVFYNGKYGSNHPDYRAHQELLARLKDTHDLVRTIQSEVHPDGDSGRVTSGTFAQKYWKWWAALYRYARSANTSDRMSWVKDKTNDEGIRE